MSNFVGRSLKYVEYKKRVFLVNLFAKIFYGVAFTEFLRALGDPNIYIVVFYGLVWCLASK